VRERNGVYSGNVEVTAISEICKAFNIDYFVPESQITQSPTVMVGQVVTESGIGAGFLRVRFPLPILIPPTASYSIIILQ
jgi:hypothetical protein